MQRRRGYALMLVMTISLLLAIGIGTIMSYLASAQKQSARSRTSREAYYVCDGIGRVLTRATSDALGDTRFSTSTTTTTLEDELEDLVDEKVDLDGLVGSLREPYAIDEFKYRDVDADPKFGQIALGRYKGLNGLRRTFSYDLSLRRLRGEATCSTSATIDTVRVPFSELALFSNKDLRICPSGWSTTNVSRKARYHINGDLAVSGYAIPRTTLTGSITNCSGSPSSVTACSDNEAESCVGGSTLSATASTSGVSEISTGSLGGVAGGLASGTITVSDLVANGERGTSELKGPFSTEAVPAGKSAAGSVSAPDLSNAGSMRFLVEIPTLGGQDPHALATRSHIRILDGTWYLNDGTWPGKLIWSDHTGTFRPPTGSDERLLINDGDDDGPRAIGRAQLSGTIPRRYSKEAPSPNDPIVSYGRRLAPSATPPTDRNQGLHDVHRDTHVMPININLEALSNALEATSEVNELGNLITDVSVRTNLILWVGATWPGSLDDAPSAAPSADPSDDHPPYPMCSTSCDDTRRITAVRVFNGDTIPSTQKITIATHLPLYVQGDIDRNGASMPTGVPGTPAGTIASDTPSVFFAADRVTLLSSSWHDGKDGPTTQDFAPTIYNASFLTGRYVTGSASKPAFGVERAFRFLEKVNNASANIADSPVVTGSVLIGFNAVHDFEATCYSNATSPVPNTGCPSSGDVPRWRHFYSPTLAQATNAPPGMPSFALRGIGETLPDTADFSKLIALITAIFSSFSIFP